MPNRIVRDGILTSEKVCSLSWGAEAFYRRLMSVVDDFGRYYANPKLLRAACYPLQLDQVSDADVGKWLSESRKAALVSVYEVEGKQYLEVLNFKQQVRAKASKFPDVACGCIADAEQMRSTCAADDSNCALYSETYSETKTKTETKRAKAALIPLPADFGISERVAQWAKAKGFTRLEDRLEHFLGYAKRSAKRYADWDEAFMSAVREDWAKLNANGKAAGEARAYHQSDFPEALACKN